MIYRLSSCAAALLLTGNALAADWPRWRGPDGTGHVPAAAIVPRTLPAEARPVWRKKIGAGLGSPVVSRGTVFYFDNQENKETVHAADAATGQERWSVAFDDTFKDSQSVAGPRGTPVVDGDRVYVQSGRGEFQCLDVANGTPIWRVNFVNDFDAVFTGEKGTTPGAGRHGYTGGAMVDGDRIYVGVGGRNGASVVCFSKRDGKVLWQSQNDMPGNGGPVIASPAGFKQVLSFTVDGAIGLHPETGALLWRVPLKTSFGRHVFSPVVSGDIVLVSSHQTGLMGIRVSQQGETCSAETAFVEKRLSINFSSPVVRDGFVYGLGPAGMLFCADARTGEQKWSHELPGAGKKAHVSMLVMKDHLLVLTDMGELILVAADPAEFRVVSRLKVCGENWCNPAYADGRLYVRDAEELLCVPLLP